MYFVIKWLMFIEIIMDVIANWYKNLYGGYVRIA